MNRNTYRLVYSRVHRMCVAVAEFASANGRGGSGEVGRGESHPQAAGSPVFVLRAMVLAALALLGVMPVWSLAQIVPGGAHAPNVINTPNGINQVNVNRPSGAGVSMNTYNQFDVNQKGAILNNSPTITNTQLAGQINGNPNYAAGQSARIIVNQVNSANPSQLNGFVEVAGQRATVVLANPSGIAVNGGGFINTNRAVLTTGIPQLDANGALTGYSVTGGTITVQGAGFNASNVDQVDLLARAVQINAAVYANSLNVIAGSNNINHDTLAATPIAGNGAPPPVSIDVSQLGGMYAGKIYLSSNEHGVGVGNAGVIAAQAGDFTLSSDGRVLLTGRTTASGNVIVNSNTGITNSGTTYAQGALSANTAGDLTNSGTLAAQGALNAGAGAVSSTGSLASGVNSDGVVTQAANLNVASSGALTATGHNVAGGDASLTGASVNLAGGETAANGNLSLVANAGDLNLSGATTSAQGAINAQATGSLVNDHGAMTGGAVTLNAGRLSNQGGNVSAQGPLNATAAGDVLNQGGVFVSQGAMQVRGGGAIANGQGTMQSAMGFSLAGTSLDNTAGRITSLNGDGLNLGVTGTLLNGLGGVIGGNGNVQASAYTFTNVGQFSALHNAVLNAWNLNNAGSMSAGDALTATASGALSNAGGSFSGTNTTVTGASINNAKGSIAGDTVAVSTPGDLNNEGGSITQTGASAQTVSAGGKLDNANGGSIASNATNLTVAGASVSNDAGSITHAGSGTLAVNAGNGAGAASNVGGNITGNGNVVAQAGTFNNTGGSVSGQGSVSATAGGALNNTNGKVLSNTDLGVTSGSLTNDHGQLSAGSSVTVHSGSMTNSGGKVVAPNLSLTVASTLDNSQGDIEANALSLNAANLLNRGGSITQYGTNPLGLSVNGMFDNSAGGTLQTNSTDLTLTPASLDNDGGTITHTGAGTLAIDAGNGAGAISNAGGTITSNGKVSAQGGALNNERGSISGQAGVTANLSGALDNTSGKVLSNTDLSLTSGSLGNDGGQLGAGTNGSLRTGSLTNSGGSIVAPNLSVSTTGTLDNSQGDIEANQLLLSAANLLNRGGSITQFGTNPLGLSVSGTFDNSAGGTLQANSTDLTLAAGALDNDGGTIIHAGNGSLTLNAGNGAGAISNAAGTIASNGKIAAQGGALNNAGGSISGQTGVTASIGGTLDNSGGKVLSSTDLSVTSGTLTNDNGQLGAGSKETIQTGSLTNNGGSIVAPNLSVSTAGTLDNSQGDIEANQLALNAANLLNHGGSITQYGTNPLGLTIGGVFDNSAGGTLQANSTDLTLAAGALDNDGGTLIHAGNGSLTLNAGNGAGAISNAAGAIVSNGNIAAQGATLNNAGGSISGQAGVKATVSGTLNNIGGKVLSNADLSVTSGALTNDDGQLGAGSNETIHTGSLTNNGGAIVAPNLTIATGSTLDNSGGDIESNQLALSATDVVNHGGTITQYGAALMGLNVSGTFDNSAGGTLQTNSTDLTLAPWVLNNNGGSILHAGTGTFTIAPGNGAGAFANVGGRIITAGQLVASAGSFDNTSGVFAAQGYLSATIAGVLNNTQGVVRSLSSATLASGGALINTGGQIQSGTADAGDTSALAVQAASIDNTGGLIGNLGTGATTVQGASQLVNTGGQVTGNGNVDVTASAIVNTQGGQMSGANVEVTGDTLDNASGAIGNVAGLTGDVTVTTTGAINNANGQMGATHDLAVSASTLTGGGAYSAANDVSVSMQGDFAPTPDVQFNAGHNLSFTLPGTFTNAALVEAANNLDVNAGDVVNSGTMMAGGTLSTHSNTLENTGVIVGGSVSLNANSTLSNVGPTALIGATDSNGTLELLASDIENRDDTTAGDTQATTAVYGLGKVVLAGGKNADGSYTNAALINNVSALVESAGDMELHADQVTNTRREVTTTGFNQPVDPALLDQFGISLSGCISTVTAACAANHPFVGWINGTADLIGGVPTDPPHGGQWNSGWQYTTYTGVAVANLIAGISPQGQIIAGGSLDASSVGQLRNYWSAVAAVGNIAAPVSLDQNSWQGQAAPGVQVTYSGYYHYTNYDHSIADWTLPFGDAPFTGGQPGGYTQAAPADIRNYALPAYESSFVAGGTLSGTGISINNTAGNAGIPSIGLAPGQALSGVTVSGISGNASGGTAGGASSVSGNASGANAGGAQSVSGNAGGTSAGGASSVSGNAGGTKAGGASAQGGTAPVDPAIASATAVNVLQNLTIPQGGLFKPSTTPGTDYLIETNPAFTSQKTFISSDYYLQQLGLNPQTTEKRLGDGFYEQQLVRNQITSLTGKAVLGPYTDLQSMYQSLLAAGASLSKSLDLPLGMSLSPEQVAALTSNVIIMQTQMVDGQSVLVPVVYLAKASQQNMNGPLIAATDIDIQNAQTFTNSGTVQAGNSMKIDAQSINNTFGALTSGGLMALQTAGNVDLTSAKVNAGSLALNAGGSVILDTATRTLNQISATGATRVSTTLDPMASLNVAGNAAIVTGGNFEQHGASLSVGGNLGMAVGSNYDIGTVQTGEHKVVERANGVSNTNINTVTGSTVNVGGVSVIGVGGDLSATGANINLGGGGTVAAKGNVTLDAAKATSTIDSNDSGSDAHGSYSSTIHRSDDTLTATTLNSGNSLTVVSGNNINVNGSSVNLDKGTLALAATGDVNIGAATETHVDSGQEQHSHSNVVSGKQVQSSRDTTTTLSQGSTVSADSVSISGHDINVNGSTVVGTNDVALDATHDINIGTTQNTMQSSGSYAEKRTGLGTSGLTVTAGTSKLATTDQESSVTNNASTVGSINGNLSMQAGNTLHVTGSDVVAGGNVTGMASNIIIDSATDTAHQAQTQKTSSSGISIGLSGSVGDAINNAYAQGQSVGHSAGSGNDRAAALHVIAAGGDAALAGFGAYDMVKNGVSKAPGAPSIGVQVSVGSSKSQSQSSEDQTTQRGSNVTAGGTAAFVATGDGTPGSGNVTVAGSNVSANDVLLAAKNQVNVVNTTNTDSTRSSNSSNSASVGASVGTNGFGVSAAMSNAHGDANSDAQIQNASHVNGTNSVTVISGGDTNITGSQVNGGKVVADVGGNLNVASVQDVTTSAAHQSSAGGGFSISQAGGSASFSAQNGHADANYAGVNEQAGTNAGSGGFDINVKGNTGLTGAVISSTADASKNSLNTGTLTFSDIQNQSHYDANSNGISAGVGVGNTGKATGPGSVSGQPGVSPMIGQNDSGDQSATTRSAISAGTINVTDGAHQSQDVATLSRDTTNTNGTVSNAPDVNAMLNQQADTMQAAQAAGQVVAQGIGVYADKKRDDAVAAGKAAADSGDVAAGDAALADYKNWKEGGDYRAIAQAAGGALIGGLGGGGLGAVGGAAGAGITSKFAPETKAFSDTVASATDSSLIGNIAGNILSGLAGAAVGGTAGAAGASNVNLYNQGHDKNETEAQKEAQDIRKQLDQERAMLGQAGAKATSDDSIGKLPVNPGALGGGKFALTDNRATKIFGTRDGHIADTAQNRALLTDVANDPTTTLGPDKFGTVWSAKIQPDGTQVWVQTRNGQVWNGGVNQTPLPYNPETGLAAPIKPGWK
ncbi:hemagglutinin repeat-containing protein [Paraburkholderia unamae]|uniref:Filamentous hemagglutinin n=1 Tax=Paraburkholderia unamae TaxID=219649 RepID=A0ABX5KNI4_9BURK|nr:hemagglutinin repeat-containing protein [Paraburkholderia unamae]PVX82656.1 filamentous hemagglutinin [Paraburkholderia unamae]